MKKKGYLLLLGVVTVAFWQLVFLQNGMKWDFVDAFLPSRYFFSESILNNQFPLWNPYLLYGTPIYADLASVFNPEFWIVANMFGYSNISLQFMYLLYVFVAGVSFKYFLKQFNTEHRLALGLAIAYMLSGFSIGNAQHLSFVLGYAIFPFVLAAYIQLTRQINTSNLLRFVLGFVLMTYASYPGLTIILGYLLLCIFIYYLLKNRLDKSYLRKFLIYHLYLAALVILSSSVLLVSYFQAIPFLSRYSGLTIEQAVLNPFSFQSLLSFLLPMSTGNASQFFETDTSMSNGYWGIISVVLFLFCLTKKAKQKESYLFLLFGVLSLLVSMGNQFFLREFLFDYIPLMDLFKYPSIFRAFAIFGFLAFIGINLNTPNFSTFNRRKLIIISSSVICILFVLLFWANQNIETFGFFTGDRSISEEILNSTLYDNIILQGSIQISILLGFILIMWRMKNLRYLSIAVLFLFVLDGIVATQLNTHYTVISQTNPVKFYNYLKSSPKGFPIPDLNPIAENSDKNAGSEFAWMNNNVFPKKVTYDGLVSFKLDGYAHLADYHPELLEAIKKEPLIYLSDDIAKNTKVEKYKSSTIFLSDTDFKLVEREHLQSDENDELAISDFSPSKIEIDLNLKNSQLLCYQQNYYKGWKVSIDGIEQELLQSNFAHMAVFVPSGKHTVVFKYSNPIVKYTFYFVAIIFITLLAFSLYHFLKKYPEKKKRTVLTILFYLVLFVLSTGINRYLYKHNKLGLEKVISKKMADWKHKHNNDISIFLSTYQTNLENAELADTICFVDEKTNKAELSNFLIQNKSSYFAFAWQGCIISNDILELIASFYPQIVEKEQNHNSGIIVLAQSDEKTAYMFCENFESEVQSGWSIDKNRIVKNREGSNHVYSYNTNEAWGTTLTITVEKEISATDEISIIADFLIRDSIVDIPLVCSIDRDGETYLYDATLINQFAKKPDQWSRAVFSPKLKRELHKGDIIKVYFWNKNNAHFLIDNLKLKFSSTE